MDAITLYYAPRTCSRVTLAALEEIGLPYTAKWVEFGREVQKSAEYLAVNPNGEVPALLINGNIMTQNPAILHYLDSRHPEAGLLPKPDKGGGLNEGLQDLVWCSVALHIARRQVLNPGRFTVGDLDQVRTSGLEYWGRLLPIIEKRLSGRRWWYGEKWSILDVYMNWGYSTINLAVEHDIVRSPLIESLEISRYYPAIDEHHKRVTTAPSYLRALAQEQAGLSNPAT